MKEAVSLVNGQQTAIVQGQSSLRQTVGEHTMVLENIMDKLDGMVDLTTAVTRMSIAIETSTIDTKHHLEKILDILAKQGAQLEQHAEDIQGLKLVPAKQALKLQDIIKGLFISVFAGGVLMLLWDKAVSVWRSTP
jgi:hypothetical protein